MSLATVIHKESKTILRNVETTKLILSDYIVNPSQEILDTPSVFWVIVGDTITIMNEAEKAVILLPIFKKEKLGELEVWWEALCEAGITVTYNSNNYTFSSDDKTFSHLVNIWAFAQAAVNSNYANANKTYPIYDRAGTQRNLTTAQIAGLLARYGTTRLTDYNNYTQKKEAIKAALSKAALDAIII